MKSSHLWLRRLHVIGLLLLTVALAFGCADGTRPLGVSYASTAPVVATPSSDNGARVVPFKIRVSDAVLVDLKERLARAH